MSPQSVLEAINWYVYENAVFEAVRQAFAAYSNAYLNLPAEKVYGVSIYTDPQIQITCINFETAHHAKWEFFTRAGVTDEQELQEAVDGWDPYQYPTMLRSFKHYEYRCVEHQELLTLNLIDYAVHEADVAAFSRIEASLLQGPPWTVGPRRMNYDSTRIECTGGAAVPNSTARDSQQQ